MLRGDVVADANGDGTLSPAELEAVIRPLVSQHYQQTPQMLPKLREDPDDNVNRSFFVHVAGSTNTPSISPMPPPAEESTTLKIWIDRHIFGMARGLERVQGVTASANEGGADLKVERNGTETWLVLPNNHPLARYGNGDEEGLKRALIQQATAQPLRMLHHAEAGFSVQLERSGSSSDGMAIEGDLVGFSMRAPRAVYYLALDIDPNGNISVLYPYTEAELEQVPANQVVDLGGQIRVKGPFGTDYVKVFAFSQLPATLGQWVGQTDIAPSDPRFRQLACLVGLAMPSDGGQCQEPGVADATFTLSTYPASEVIRH